MQNYEHKRLIDRISQIDKVPEGVAEYAAWIEAGGHLALLRDNAEQNELIIYAVSKYSFIHTVVISEDNLSPLNHDDLLRWSGNSFNPLASYAYGGGKEGFWIANSDRAWDSKSLQGARQLVFARRFEGLNENEAYYYEIRQEYSHVTDIHWRPERHAYCRFDENGDFDHVVSITSKADTGDVALVSFKREPLERYLAASNSVLVRMFDFMLLKYENFTAWPDDPKAVIKETDALFYRQKVDPGQAAYTRGVQIIRPRRPKTEIFEPLKRSWSGNKGGKYVEFVAYDWRNQRIANISTDPSATTNYFQAQENSLPFELSPAFFRPDVLLKYKGDSDKYTVEQRAIHCRGAWSLRDYDVNEAGQVHVYICDLRNLPYQEQVYWQSYNEKPKSNISERAFVNHFKGEPFDPDPLENVLFIMTTWAESGMKWWKLREEGLLDGISTPHTDSRDEWARAFQDLSKLIIEGFEVKAIRKRLEAMNIAYKEKEQSLALLEKLLDGEQRLDGLRAVQSIRSKVNAHSRGRVAADLGKIALREHGTYSTHFQSVCRMVADELKLIEQAFS
ncbi:MAG: hypothetical protein OXF97_07035 [Nitrospira sp.]|nr:hypothetical protein [Nitrospira sp.]